MNHLEIQNHVQFEQLVVEILDKTDPDHIDWRTGGRDRGQDIIIHYTFEERQYKVIIECKNHIKSIGVREIATTVSWAQVHRPDLLYFWITPYLTPDAKDFLNEFSKNFKIPIAYEDEVNIKSYQQALKNGEIEKLKSLRRKLNQLFRFQRNEISKNDAENLEYETTIIKSDHFLIDRNKELKALKEKEYKAFYLYGLSGSGKTQIAKKLAQHFYKNNYKIFWHSILNQNDSTTQIRSFLQSLSTFFEFNYSDNTLFEYHKIYGFALTNQLLLKVKSLLLKYKPTIFIDDAHNCKRDNDVLIALFVQTISEKICTIYFLGWFNIFPLNFDIKSKIKFIPIRGLEKRYIYELISKISVIDPSQIVMDLLSNKFKGLPFYAIHSDKISKDINYIRELPKPELFFRKILQNLSQDEIDIINALSISRLPLRIAIFRRYGLISQLETLCDKKIIHIAGSMCVLHDTIRVTAINNFRSISINKCVSNILKFASQEESATLIDLILAYINIKQFDNALILLNENFYRLVDDGYDLFLIKIVQNLIEANVDFVELTIKKVILYERVGEYENALFFIDLLDSNISTRKEFYQTWIYIKNRCLYFKCEFDTVIENILMYVRENILLDPVIKLQMLFVLGRICYIRGYLRESLILYVQLFNESISTKSQLAIKAIHRIAMIECALGFHQDALNSFMHLIKLKSFTSVKRKSFIYYRIAKCYFSLGQTDEAKKYNEKSLEIKKSFNHTRGIIFSYKLKARILKEKDLYEALFWSEKAYKLSHEINIDKEKVGTGILLSEILCELSEYKEASKILKIIIPICVNLKLGYRLKLIKKILDHQNRNLDEFSFDSLCSEPNSFQDDLDNYIGQIYCNFNAKTKKAVEDVYQKNRPVTPILIQTFSL